MVKLLTNELGTSYSRYGVRQSAKNEVRGTTLHVVGGLALLVGTMLPLCPSAATLDKESLSITFFGIILYVVVHFQDVLALRSMNEKKILSKKFKRRVSSFSFVTMSREYIIAWLYLGGSLSFSAAVALSNPRWTLTVLPYTSKLQYVVAAITFSFAASLNLTIQMSQISRTRKENRRSNSHLKLLANITFLSGSNFQLAGSMLQLRQMSFQCVGVQRVSAEFYNVGLALHLVGAIFNHWSVKAFHVQKKRNERLGLGGEDHENESHSEHDGARRRRTGKKSKNKGVMGWFSGNRDVADHSFNSSNHTDSTLEYTDSNTSASFSSDEEAISSRQETRTRGVRRGH